MYLEKGLKMSQHWMYMIEEVNKGKDISTVCNQKFRKDFYEKDSGLVNLKAQGTIIDQNTLGNTFAERYSMILRNNRKGVLYDAEVCKMMNENFVNRKSCFESENYQRSLVSKSIVEKSFESNCEKYLPELMKMTGCMKKAPVGKSTEAK